MSKNLSIVTSNELEVLKSRARKNNLQQVWFKYFVTKCGFKWSMLSTWQLFYYFLIILLACDDDIFNNIFILTSNLKGWLI